MKCPICEVDLQMTERQGVEIDYCSKCRGVWLDRGELDKIIEKSVVESPDVPVRQSDSYRDDHHHKDSHSNYSNYGQQNYKKRKGGIIGELFDF